MIKKAYIEERNGKMCHESLLVAEELKDRGIPYNTFTIKKIHRRQLPLDIKTLVVGDMDCSYGALRQLDITIPKNNDYPVSLEHLLYRKIWTSTLGNVKRSISMDNSAPVFVKPAGRKKCFTGFAARALPDFYQCHGVSKREPVFCSELVKWISEFRIYVVRSKIVSIDFYDGDKEVKIDEKTVKEAIDSLDKGRESYAGYAIDFGVLSTGQTALVEMNDGFSVGAYEIDKRNYTDMVIARWEELLSEMS